MLVGTIMAVAEELLTRVKSGLTVAGKGGRLEVERSEVTGAATVGWAFFVVWSSSGVLSHVSA